MGYYAQIDTCFKLVLKEGHINEISFRFITSHSPQKMEVGEKQLTEF